MHQLVQLKCLETIDVRCKHEDLRKYEYLHKVKSHNLYWSFNNVRVINNFFRNEINMQIDWRGENLMSKNIWRGNPSESDMLKYLGTGSTRENNSQIETQKYLISINYNLLINITNCTNTCLMVSKFFRRSTNHKQRVNKKHKLPITCT